MRVKVFTLPWRPEAGGFDDGALQAFLQERIVLEAFVHHRLDLVLKASVTRLLPTHSGVPFLGFAVFPQTLRFSPAHARRFCARQRQLRRTLRQAEVAPLASGGSAEEDALPVAASLQGWASHGDTFHFRKAYQARFRRVTGATVG